MKYIKKKIQLLFLRFQRIKKSKSLLRSLRKHRLIWTLGICFCFTFTLFIYEVTHLLNLRFNTPKEFFSVWNSNDSFSMTKMLASFDEIMARYRIEHFMIFETLLGSQRHGDFIPWNRRVVFAINQDQLDASYQNISSALEHLDLNLEVEYLNISSNYTFEDIVKYKRSIRWNFRKDLEIELIPFYSNGKHVIIEQEDKTFRFPIDSVRPITRRMLHGNMYSSPKQPEKILTSIYGSGWPIFCYSSNFAIPCRDLRFSYFMNLNEKNDLKIPKIIHQLWIGNGKPPYEIMKTCRRLHPSWEYKYWDNSNIPERMKTRRIFDATKTIEGRADILRWEILNKYGGVWIDADTACLKPLDEILDIDVSFFFGYHHFRNPELSNSSSFEDDLFSTNVIGASPNHPILKKMIVDLRDNFKQVSKASSKQFLGPNYLTKFIDREAENGRFLEMSFGAFPFYYFAPKHKLEVKSQSESIDVSDILYNSFAVDLTLK